MDKRLLFLFLLLTSLSVNAQNYAGFVNLGVVHGAPIGPSQEGDTGILQMGPMVELGVTKELSDRFDLELGLGYSYKRGGYVAQVAGDTIFEYIIDGQPPVLFPTTYKGWVNGSFKNHYLELALRAKYKFGRSRIILGCYNALLLSGSHTGNVDLVLGNNFSTIEDDFDDSEYLRSFDFGVTFGGELEVWKSHLSIGFTGSYGLTNLFTPNYDTVEGKFGNLYMKPYLHWTIFSGKG